MRDKHLLQLFLGLNVALVAGVAVYFVVSSNRRPAFAVTSFPAPVAPTNLPARAAAPLPTPDVSAPPAQPETNSLPAPPSTAVVVPAATNASPAPAVSRKFDWRQIQADAQDGTAHYQGYLDTLRVAGCPEDKVRYIALADINELFAQKRLKEAMTHDTKWWRSELELSVSTALQEKGRTLEDERRALITRYLGAAAAEAEQGEAMLWSNTQLTGPVLGRLSPEIHNAVQEIYGRSRERFLNSQAAEAQSPNAVEAARLRERTRADLRKVLNAEEMEEFLLRYSQNSRVLREELRGFDPTPDEFRKIFRATDPLDHQLQLEYGTLNALSPQQRERHLALREAAIKEALGPKRYQDYRVIKDPLYEQARVTATRYGAPEKAVMAIYQLTKTNDLRRQKILNDSTLDRPQKEEALSTLRQEEIRGLQEIVTGARQRD